MLRKQNLYYLILVGFIAVHICLAILATPSPSSKLKLDPNTGLLLRLTFLPISWATWYFGIRSALAIHEYAKYFSNISPAKEEGLKKIGYGILILVANLAVAAILGSSRNFFPIGSLGVKILTIITNYCYVAFPLLGLWFLYKGSLLLTRPNLSPRKHRDNFTIAFLFSFLVTVLYGLVVFTSPDRLVSSDPLIRPTYFLSDPLIFLTIILPSFGMWLLGILAAFQVDQFTLETFSVQQHLAKRRFVNGILMMIFASTSIQVLLALGGLRLLNLGLVFIFLAIYLVLLFLVYAYFLIMRGARGLLSESTRVSARTD
jgi:hypothetical protein